METGQDPRSQHEELWREILTSGPHGLLTRGPLGYRIARWLLRRLPHNPRCQNCYIPFEGVASKMVRLFGFAPSRKNPKMCDF